MRKCNIRIEDNHIHELHHALGCPWPDEIHGDTYRNYFAVGHDSGTARRMRASPHWDEGRTFCGMTSFHVTEEGKDALLNFISENIEIPRRYSVTYKDYEGEEVVIAKSRSAAKYAAYRQSECEWPFVEYARHIKSVRIHDRGHKPQNP